MRTAGGAEIAADEVASLCAQLVRIPSPNPPGDTRSVAGFVRRHLAGLGLEVQAFAPDVLRPNLVATIGTGRPHLLLNGHLDTFPPAEGNVDAYSGRVEAGRIYGCGVSDMKAGVAVTLALARVLAEARDRLRGSVSFIYSSDEETGGSLGTSWLLGNVPGLRSADFCYVLDQSGSDQVAAGEKGACWVRIRTTGGGGHAAYRRNASAIEALIKVLEAVLGIRERALPGSASGAEESPAARAVTVNVGRIQGGVSPNLIATSAIADVDVRVPVGSDAQWALDAVMGAIAASGVPCETEVTMFSDPSLTDPASTYVELVCRHAGRQLGREVRPLVRVGASDARLFRRAGVPAVVYGPAAHDLGSADEHVEVADLHAVAAVYTSVLGEALGLQ